MKYTKRKIPREIFLLGIFCGMMQCLRLQFFFWQKTTFLLTTSWGDRPFLFDGEDITRTSKGCGSPTSIIFFKGFRLNCFFTQKSCQVKWFSQAVGSFILNLPIYQGRKTTMVAITGSGPSSNDKNAMSFGVYRPQMGVASGMRVLCSDQTLQEWTFFGSFFWGWEGSTLR